MTIMYFLKLFSIEIDIKKIIQLKTCSVYYTLCHFVCLFPLIYDFPRYIFVWSTSAALAFGTVMDQGCGIDFLQIIYCEKLVSD